MTSAKWRAHQYNQYNQSRSLIPSLFAYFSFIYLCNMTSSSPSERKTTKASIAVVRITYPFSGRCVQHKKPCVGAVYGQWGK